MNTQAEKGARFARSHVEPGMLVLPNAWDAGSAVMMVEAGFQAIGTTSAGIAFSMGLPDGEHIGRDRMLERVAQIVAAVPVPVTADLEAGYGPRPEDVAATVRAALVRRSARELFERGTFGYAQTALSNPEVNALMGRHRSQGEGSH